MEYGKYIIIEQNGLDLAIMFDMILSHSDIAQGFNKVLSAGFFQVGGESSIADKQDIDVSVFGKSTTLNIESRKEDARILKKVLRKEW
jgi:hypothetical protein